MDDRALIRTGAMGTIVAALCCATPVLAVLLPLVGLGAWLTTADSVVIPLLLVCLGLVAVSLYRRRATVPGHCDTQPRKGALKP